MGNKVGSVLRMEIFGTSHAPEIGMTLENFPEGFAPNLELLRQFMARRAPGQGAHTTARKEADEPIFEIGLKNGVTNGNTIRAVIRNTNAHSQDYVNLQDMPRPSHADYPARMKYGEDFDLRGGGPFSGRMTAPMCIAGGLCLQYLQKMGIHIGAQILSIGCAKNSKFDPLDPEIPSKYAEPTQEMLQEIAAAKADGDSIGGVIECAVTGLPVGLGEPMFGGLENRLAQILFGIPAVKGLEFGSGFSCAVMHGSEHNDPYYVNSAGVVKTKTNHAGGILGGLSTAMPLIFRLAIKPTPSIAKPQESICFSGGSGILEIKGRHDPCIVPRAVPVAEAAAAIAILDAVLEAKL
ncbi:MAG: chorismate synthase [Ruminococcaceae bacterium]|nr:chorismate synthase [Oscillospiraceae bacterium]